MDEQQIESELVARGKTAPRLTPADIDAVIASEMYWRPAGTTLTICILTLENGFHVVGESATAHGATFDPELGREVARANARNKIWMLEGYLLRQRLHDAE